MYHSQAAVQATIQGGTGLQLVLGLGFQVDGELLEVSGELFQVFGKLFKMFRELLEMCRDFLEMLRNLLHVLWKLFELVSNLFQVFGKLSNTLREPSIELFMKLGHTLRGKLFQVFQVLRELSHVVLERGPGVAGVNRELLNGVRGVLELLVGLGLGQGGAWRWWLRGEERWHEK